MRIILMAAAALAACGAAWGQCSVPVVFVGNNGNLEGSVSSMLVNPDGTLTFRDKYVTGSRPNTQVFHPGTNVQTISLSPNGKYIAAGHGTSNDVVEQLTILRVAADGGLSLAGIFQTPNTPLDLLWVRNDVLAVGVTNSPNGVISYLFDENGGGPGVPTLTQADRKSAGSFTSSLARHPSGTLLYVNNSSGSTIHPFTVEPNGTLTPLTVFGAPAFPLGMGVAPNGAWLYAGGGISSGGRAVLGLNIAPAGTLSSMAQSPFTSLGASPKQAVMAPGLQVAFAAHGTESSVRSFLVAGDGSLTQTPSVHVVGIQGSIGEIGVMGNLLFACDRDTINDGVRGLISFTYASDGSFVQNGLTTDTTGITPNDLAVWPGICLGDVTGDRVVNFADLNVVLSQFGQTGAGLQGDITGDGVVNFADLNIVLSNFGTIC